MQLQASILMVYSIEDKKYYKKIKNHCLAAIRKKELIIEDYLNVTTGENVLDSISIKINKADIVVLLLSSDFLGDFLDETNKHNSYIWQQILKNFEKNDIKLLPIYIRPCHYNYIDEIQNLEILPNRKNAITEYPHEDVCLEETTDRLIQIAEKEKESHIQQLFHLLLFPFSEPFILHFFSKQEWIELSNKRNLIIPIQDFWKTKLDKPIDITDKFLKNVVGEILNMYKKDLLSSLDLANILHILLKSISLDRIETTNQAIVEATMRINILELQQERQSTLFCLNQIISLLPKLHFSNTNQKAMLYKKLANDLVSLNHNLKEALRLGKKALEMISESENSMKASCLETLAVIYFSQDNYELAKEYYLKVLEIQQNSEIYSDWELVQLYWRTANSFIKLGESKIAYIKDAKYYLQQAQSIVEAFSENEDSKTKIGRALAGIYYSLSTSFQIEQNYMQSLLFCNKSLFRQRKLYQPKDYRITSTLSRLASLHFCMKEYDTALDIYGEVKATQIATLGNEHPDTLDTVKRIEACRQQLEEKN